MSGGELNGGGTMARQRELTGVLGFRSTAHREASQEYREKEEGSTLSARWLTEAQSNRGWCGARRRRVMAAALGLAMA